MGAADVADFERRFELRRRHMEAAMQAVASPRERTDEERAELLDRLARLERKRTGRRSAPDHPQGHLRGTQ